MNKTCLKCNYVRTESDSAPEYECPSCNAIYSKVESAMGLASVKSESENKTGFQVRGIDKNTKTKKEININKKYFLLMIPIILFSIFYFLPGKLNGSIFIVTQGSKTIELSNIEVFTVKKDTFSKYILSKKSDFNNCPSASNESDYLDKLLIATKKRKAQWFKDDLKREHQEMNKKNNQCTYGLFNGILNTKSNIIGTTRTDSRGSFELSVPRNKKFLVLVRASRALPFGNKEEYLWNVAENLGFSFSSNTQLSNNNLSKPKNLFAN